MEHKSISGGRGNPTLRTTGLQYCIAQLWYHICTRWILLLLLRRRYNDWTTNHYIWLHYRKCGKIQNLSCPGNMEKHSRDGSLVHYKLQPLTSLLSCHTLHMWLKINGLIYFLKRILDNFFSFFCKLCKNSQNFGFTEFERGIYYALQCRMCVFWFIRLLLAFDYSFAISKLFIEVRKYIHYSHTFK